MKPDKPKLTTKASPKAQLDGFVAKFTPEIATRTRRVLAKMRQRLPGAVELVYDNYNALAIGFGPSERTSEAIFSVAVFPRNVSLFFLQKGIALPDPSHRLEGSGKVVRHVKLKDAGELDDPAIRELMETALRRAKVPLDPKQRRKLVIRSVSAKQRPRRPRQAS